MLVRKKEEGTRGDWESCRLQCISDPCEEEIREGRNERKGRREIREGGRKEGRKGRKEGGREGGKALDSSTRLGKFWQSQHRESSSQSHLTEESPHPRPPSQEWACHCIFVMLSHWLDGFQSTATEGIGQLCFLQ